METSTETSAETNSVEMGSKEEDSAPKEESVEAEAAKPVEPVNNAPELTQSDKSAASDKELSWEKIAAEFTEDEEEELKPPHDTQLAQPEPEIPQTEEPASEVVDETVIGDTDVTDAEPCEKTVGDSGETEPAAENPEPVPEPPEDSVPVAPPSPPGEPAGEAPAEEAVESVIEISELKEDDVEPVSEDVEYTVIEEEVEETNEIIEEHLAQSNSTETVVIINPDQSQTEITIEQVEDSEKSEDSQPFPDEVYLLSKENEGLVDDPGEEVPKEVKVKKQRGRKPIADIPLHVLGRDITKPTEGVSNGGRTMPKPRLGVKVPYRNLTSQIVSKEEIEKEIMERFKLKQEQNAASSGDILFARKLTQRLAKKLIPSEKEKPSPKASESATSAQPAQTEAEIKNNSDLIAILEGEGDEIPLAKQKEASSKEPISKDTEKEIALQQLKELPISKPGKFFKTRPEEDNKPVVSPPQVKTNSEKKPEMEPRLKTGMVIKTYTRKRRSTDLEAFLPPKKNMVVATTIKSEDGSPTNVYITKSSRVIKRKKIWDPDEVPSKSPIKSPKPEASPPKSPVKAATFEKPQKSPVPLKKAAKIASPPPKKLKQRLTEVDKLLMDEGAVNMLYDVKTNDDAAPDKLKKKNNNKSVISLDRAHKELMSKANVIKNDLQQTTTKEIQKNLRKKEIATPSPPKKEEKPSPKKDAAAPVTRKKSKDSARSSLQSPPASPSYNAAEASRIIRRHSSSSFSSADEEGGDEETGTKKKSESPKKKMKKSSEAKATKEVTKNNNNTVAETKEAKEGKDKSFNQYKSFMATKKNKLVSIKLSKVDNKHYFTDQVLKELTGCLKELAKDEDCHVVSITSDSNDSFCHGLDYTFLVSDDDVTRKKKATELSTLVKDFLRCLLNFPKVLVAGIQGDCVGLGVTMLPLFDMVVATDTSTFSTPYAKLGGIPEAGFLLTVPHLGSHGLASELLYASQVVKADDAFRKGLVTRLCWPEKYHEELKALLAQVASQPRQSIMATKQQLRQHLLQSTETSLNGITKALVEHWTSSECQKNFAK